MVSKREENFKRIAESRTNKILDSIALLGNLSNKSYYDYNQHQVDAMFDAILEEVERQRERFNVNTKQKKKFRL